MASVWGPRFVADPEGEGERFIAQLKAEAAVERPQPPRYIWGGRYWVAVKHGTWPNVTGWAEHRETQRIFAPRLGELMAIGFSKEDAWPIASDCAYAEMVARTTRRKEESDRYYEQFDDSTE